MSVFELHIFPFNSIQLFLFIHEGIHWWATVYKHWSSTSYPGSYLNKLSLVGMQLSEKYEENFDVSSEGPSSGGNFARNDEILLLYFRQLHPYQRKLVHINTGTTYIHWHRQFKILSHHAVCNFDFVELMNCSITE